MRYLLICYVTTNAKTVTLSYFHVFVQVVKMVEQCVYLLTILMTLQAQQEETYLIRTTLSTLPIDRYIVVRECLQYPKIIPKKLLC